MKFLFGGVSQGIMVWGGFELRMFLSKMEWQESTIVVAIPFSPNSYEKSDVMFNDSDYADH